MDDQLKSKDYLTTSQAAKLLKVSPDTVLKWVKAGKVKSHRTLGGHFRIPLSELDLPASTDNRSQLQAALPQDHFYCWEYLAAAGAVKDECKDCITYRSRAQRCYELKDLPGEFGCLNLLCDTDCDECEYYKVVNGQGLNILVVSESSKIIRHFDATGDVNGFHIQFAANEYEAAVIIQSFRPDYIIVDCALGKNRTQSMCRNLFSDIRLPVIRIILSSKTRRIRDYCDKEVFGWIKKPFSLEQLKDCIRGVPRTGSNAQDE
jgi:excisionase family DNA binding protein